MAFTVENKDVIKLLRQTKGCSAKTIVKDVSGKKQWTFGGLNHLSRPNQLMCIFKLWNCFWLWLQLVIRLQHFPQT